jgi:hypothetical protein
LRRLQGEESADLLHSPVGDVGPRYPKWWFVEASGDAEKWVEIDRRENNDELNGMATLGVMLKWECRFLRFVNVGRNHWGDNKLRIAAWEISGSLFE